MQVEEVRHSDYHSLIIECFSSDPEYLQYHYAAEKGLEACILITVNELSSAQSYSLYRVKNEKEETVAMFGVENNEVLNPFFIKPEGRRKEVVGPLLESIKGHLNKNWMIGVYDRNEPIKKFFLKNDGKVDRHIIYNGQLVHVLVFENGSR